MPLGLPNLLSIFNRAERRSGQHARRLDGAAGGRRTFGMGSFGRVNAEVGAAGATLASRSAYLVENNALINAAIGNLVGETVGSGIRPSLRVSNPDLMTAFDEWWDVADADGRTDFAGIQVAVDRDVKVRGEAFVLMLETDDGLRLRQLDPEQIDRSMTRDLDGGAAIIQGIQIDAQGRRTAYWIAPYRETTFGAWAAPVRVDAADVLHIFRPVAPGQMRGLPWTTPIILAASEFDKLTDALLMGVSVAAMHAGFLVDLNGTGEPFDGTNDVSLEPGVVRRLPGGFDIKFNTPQTAQQTSDFVKAQIRQLAAGLGVPTHYMDGDLTGANYSSLRAGLLPFRRRVEQYQYTVFVPQFLAPVWRRWITGEYLAGRTEQPSVAVEWMMPAFDQVDPLKAVEADVAEIDAGLASRSQKVAARGWDAAALDTEIAADKERESTLNLQFGDASAAATSKKENDPNAE